MRQLKRRLSALKLFRRKSNASFSQICNIIQVNFIPYLCVDKIKLVACVIFKVRYLFLHIGCVRKRKGNQQNNGEVYYIDYENLNQRTLFILFNSSYKQISPFRMKLTTVEVYWVIDVCTKS